MADRVDLILKVKQVISSMLAFSTLVIKMPLYGYQLKAALAVVDSILHSKGLEFLWIFPRQSGKDEALAQMTVYLLLLFHRVGGSVLHVYPTNGQIANGLARLESRLKNPWTKGTYWGRIKPTRRGVGEAKCVFFSGHVLSKAEGASAEILLIVNESQDQDEGVIDRRFTPMRASTNATALYVGTVRTTTDFLWKKRKDLEALQQADGIQRVFVVGPDEVGLENEAYGAFVEGQIAAKGREHPVVKTELFNEPVDTAAGLFPARRRALMTGEHDRILSPRPGEVYIALIDVGGQDEAATTGFSMLDNPGRDYTVCTIVRVRREPGAKVMSYEAVDVFLDHGSRHFQENPGQPSLFKRLVTYLKHWSTQAVVCDMSGVGQGLTDALIEAYRGRVFGFEFAKGHNKAELGNNFLSLIETGRFRYFKDGQGQGDAFWFFLQCEFCGYELAQGVPIERGLRWGVRPGATWQDAMGNSHKVHDDRLLSAALVAEGDRLFREGQWFASTGESAVIHREVVDESQW